MIVVPGPASKELGLNIARILGVKVVPIEFKHFPDGESYIRFTESTQGENVVIVQTTGPPQDTSLIQLLLLIDTAKELGAKSIAAVVPYVAYGRQNSRFRDGEAISSKTVFRLLKNVDIDHFITVNFHVPEILKGLKTPFENVSAIQPLAEHMLSYGLSGAFSLAPDEGAIKLVEESSKILKGGYGWLRKERDKVTGDVAFNTSSLEVKGKDVVIFDDIISSGSTMISAVKILKTLGTKRIYVACVHPLLIGNALQKVLAEGALSIVGTDCVRSLVSSLSVAPLLADILRRCFCV